MHISCRVISLVTVLPWVKCHCAVAWIGISAHQDTHWTTDYVAPADYNYVLFACGIEYHIPAASRMLPKGSPEQIGKGAHHAAQIDGMETVYIFSVVDCFSYLLRIDVFKKGKLNYKSIHACVLVNFSSILASNSASAYRNRRTWSVKTGKPPFHRFLILLAT